MKVRLRWHIIALGAVLASCGPDVQETLFVELRSQDTGITFTNSLAESEDFNIIEYLYYYNGGGVAVGDINNDGLPDIYFTANEGENRLYLNEGAMKFQDITEQAGVASSGLWKTGASMVDVNGDGLLDIYQTRVSGYKGLVGHNELYLNNGDMTFTESAAEWGLDFEGFSTHSGFFDMDNDGDLDLYLLNHAVHTPNSFGRVSLRLQNDSISGDRIYENIGDAFVDITQQTDIYSSAIGYGLGIGFTDFNQDGFTDLYVSNDFSENDYFYLNNGDKTFTEMLESQANRTSRFSMGNDLSDLNNDGLVDIMTLDMMPEDENVRKRSAGDDSYEVLQTRRRLGYMEQFGRNSVLLNQGNGHFSDIGLMSGLYATDWSWSTLIADYDLDGHKDIFVSNGIWRRPNDLDFIDFIGSNLAQDPNLKDAEFTARMPEGKVKNYFFKNGGDLSFRNVSSTWAKQKAGVTNGATYSDLDLDGDLDIVLNHLNVESAILKNLSRESGSNYLRVSVLNDARQELTGVSLQCWTGGMMQLQEIYSNRGFQSSTTGPAIIGLGQSTTIDSLIVHWGGKKLVKYNLEANQDLKISAAEILDRHSESVHPSWFKKYESLEETFIHRDNTFWEFTREPLMPHMNSFEGPAFAMEDVNGDRKQDLFLGGAKRQPSQLLIRNEEGFVPMRGLELDSIWEDVDASFLDVENDGDLDLFVVSGGNEFFQESQYQQPRLYLKEDGVYHRDTTMLPTIFHTGSTVAVHDYNKDGYPDLFLGSLAVVWNYGITPESYLLTNKGGNSFEIASDEVPGLADVGMVKDAIWIDLDGNGEKDLVVAALWQPITVFYVENGKLGTGQAISDQNGWWQTVLPVDIDQDGDMDLALGNLGLNTKLKASSEEPVRLYIKDIDNNNKLDHVLTYYRDGQESAFASKKDLVKPLTYINRRIRSYEGYAQAELDEIFGSEALEDAEVLEAHEFRSGLLINEGDSFTFKPFSIEGQTTMIRSITYDDLDGDGIKDLFLAGNFSHSTLQDAPYTEGYGTFYQIKDNDLEYVPNAVHGIYLKGEVIATQMMELDGKPALLVVKNNDAIEWWIRD